MSHEEIRLIKPTLELEKEALEYRQEHFDFGERVINGSELFDKIASYDEWLAKVFANASAETVDPTADCGTLITSETTLAVTFNGTLIRKYTCNALYIEWDYTLPTCTVTPSVKSGSGTVTGGGTHNITQFNSTVSSGGSWTLKATPSAGYKFDKWVNASGATLSTSQTYTYTVNSISANSTSINVYAVFEKAKYYLDVNGWVNGEYASDLNNVATFDVYINGSVVESNVYDYWIQHEVGTTYEIKNIKANPGWEYKGVHSGSISGTINAATAVELEFSKIKCTVSASGDGGTVTGGGTYDYGSQVTLTATPNTGYSFEKWSDGNTDNPRVVTVNANAEYTAVFKETNTAPKIVSANLIYGSGNMQVSPENKVPVGQGYIVSVGIA